MLTNPTRDEMVKALVEYQLDCVFQCEDYQTTEEVLAGIFERGFVGFQTMTEQELIDECFDAGLMEDTDE